jgi:predicted Zn finger-like uncharacterized protein
MIVACPSCATRYDYPASRFSGTGTMVRCAECGHSWIESRVAEVIDIPARSVPAIDVDPDADREIKRLVDASRAAQELFEAQRRNRQKHRRGWAAFAAAIGAPVVLAMLFPEQIVRTAPAAARIYERAGIGVNIYGLEIRHVEQKHLIVDGASRVLAIKGDIVNVSGSDRKVPSLRFILRDQSANEVYAWTLDASMRPLRPGEMTSFTTRVASPPADAQAVQIRFARIDEIGSNAKP